MTEKVPIAQFIPIQTKEKERKKVVSHDDA